MGGIIEMYKATYSVTKTRLSVIQALLSQGIITHAQYMGLMYMKSFLSCKLYHEGSVIAEAGKVARHAEYAALEAILKARVLGSLHGDSDSHDVELEHNDHDHKHLARDQVRF